MPPTMLIDTLSDIRRRVRLLSVLYGAGIVVAAAVALLLVTVLLDYLLNLPAIPRVLLILASLGGLGYLMARWVVHPALAKLGLSDVAGKLENVFPEFNDRLRSTVDFLSKGTPGSDVMKNRVVSEASELVGRVDLRRAVETKPVWYSLGAGGGAVALAVLLAVLAGGDYVGPAFARLLMPFGAHAWPKRVQIEVLGTVPTRVPVGQHVDLRLHLVKGDKPSREARVFYQYGNGRVEEELMTRGADGVYSASLDARADAKAGGNGEMKVWVSSGDDEVRFAPITLVQRLAITKVELVQTPPPYVNEPATTIDLSAQPATVTVGSGLAVNVTFNKDLAAGQPVVLTPIGRETRLPDDLPWTVGGPHALGKLVARSTIRFQVHATDVDGFTNPGLEEYQVIVRPDQMPSVQITRPTRNEECTPQAVIPLRGIAEDDYGIKSVQLIATRLADKKVFPVVDLVKDAQPATAADGIGFVRLDATGERRRWQVDYNWDLSKLDATPLKPGDVIEYWLRVQDNYALDGDTHPPVESGKLRITILSQEQFTSLMSDLLNQVRDAVNEVKNSQNRTKTETGDLKQDTATKPAFDKADREVAQRLTNQQSTAAAQAKQAAGKLQDIAERMEENRSTATELKDIANSVKEDLNQAAEHPMKDAANGIDQAKETKADPKAPAEEQKKQLDARNGQLDQAQANQQSAADALQRALDKMGSVGGLQPAIDKFNKLLADQQDLSKRLQEVGKTELGKKPEQMDPEKRKELEKVAAEQAELGKKTDKALSDLDANSKKLEKSDQPTSKAMSEAADTGRQQNVPPNMQQASDQAGQNQQSGAQAKQKQVEIGLQLVLSQLKEAQKRNLEALAKKLEDLQKQVAELIQQQSGHNLDNLALQGGDVMKKTDPKLLEELLLLADRAKDKLPPTPDLAQQTSLQEQTERNTRNVAHVAEALPEGAEPSAQLSRAAEKMGRAISALRDETVEEAQRLPKAYEPPQTEALAALQQAKKTIDDQKAKADQQLAEKEREAIRKVFEEILAAQKKLDADTVAIDKTPKADDGSLPHLQATRLAQLPGEQGGLSKRCEKLTDDLESVGGVVYVWANKDIVSTMGEVKADLAKPETGVPTQTEQARIEKQLEAMIKDLAIHPKQSPFASKGGGGGGKPPPQLPQEAELRLLKDLQTAVNDATKTIGEQKQKDKPKLLALGGRQGELRNLLGELLKKSSHGQIDIGPEPDNKDQLPEEASAADIDQNELQHDLLDGKEPGAEEIKKDTDLVGARMGRSHQRLADNADPGKVTQEIQSRILKNLDDLVEMARVQQSQGKGSGKPQGKPQNPGGQGQQPVASGKQPGNAKAGAQGPKTGNGGSTPAGSSTGNADTDASTDLKTNIEQLNKEWGGLSPRRRAAMTEVASEKPLEKFRKIIDDYYKSLATKATEH